MMRSDPAAIRWLIGGELARYREDSGLSIADVAAETGLTRTKINHMEHARTVQTPDEIREVLTTCGVGQEDVERLAAVAAQPQGKPWWKRWQSLVPEWYGLYLGLEGMASSVFAYETGVLHGLLQTEDYAADVTRQSSIVSPEAVDRFVSLRMSRSERLQSEAPLKYHAILDEAVLRRKLLNPKVLVSQCSHLLEVAKLPHVTLQVMPTARGMHGVLGMGNYSLLDFDGLNGIAYSELYGDALFIRDVDKVRSYRAAAEHMDEIALSPEESRRFITDLKRSVL